MNTKNNTVGDTPTSTVKKTAQRPPTGEERYDTILDCIDQAKVMKKTLRKNFLARGVRSKVYKGFDRELVRDCVECIDSILHLCDHLEYIIYAELGKEATNG